MNTKVGLTILILIGGLLLPGCTGMKSFQDFSSKTASDTSDFNGSDNQNHKSPWYHGSWD